MITKAERTELRSIVRQQFKVLRSELEQREMEMHNELEEQIAARFAAADQQWAGVQHEVHEAVMEANRRINDALHQAGFQVKDGTERLWVQSPRMVQPTEARMELRRLGVTRIHRDVHAARLRLDRDEADLLRTLAVGAIESDEAREFLTAIPTVGELVPAHRLAELEAQLADDDTSAA